MTFTIRYRGVPAAGLRIGPNMHGERTFFGENWPNLVRHWLPMIDHPYDKATGEFIVTAPSHYQVVANGLLVEELDLPNGLRRTHWKQSVPIASWLYTLGVARFAVASRRRGRRHSAPDVGVPAGSRCRARAVRRHVAAGAAVLHRSSIGPYSVREARQRAGHRLHAAAPSTRARSSTARRASAPGRGPVVHEIAHQWFGDSVTERDWDDVWLSEGFATYFALLFTEHDEGRDAFVDGLKRSRAQVLQLEQKLPDTPVIHRNLADMEQGAEQPGLPEGRLGAAHAAAGSRHRDISGPRIREYYRRYRNGNASTAELRAVFEQVSGKHARVVLHAVADIARACRRSRARGATTRQESGRGDDHAVAGGRGVPRQARCRHRREGRRPADGRDAST